MVECLLQDAAELLVPNLGSRGLTDHIDTRRVLRRWFTLSVNVLHVKDGPSGSAVRSQRHR